MILMKMKTEDVTEAIASINKTADKLVIFNLGGGNFGTHCLLTVADPSDSILEVRTSCCSRSLAESLEAGCLPPPQELKQTAFLLAKSAWVHACGLHDGPVVGIGMVCNFNIAETEPHECVISVNRAGGPSDMYRAFTYRAKRNRIEEDAVAGHILIQVIGEVCKAEKILDASTFFEPNEAIDQSSEY